MTSGRACNCPFRKLCNVSLYIYHERPSSILLVNTWTYYVFVTTQQLTRNQQNNLYFKLLAVSVSEDKGGTSNYEEAKNAQLHEGISINNSVADIIQTVYTVQARQERSFSNEYRNFLRLVEGWALVDTKTSNNQLCSKNMIQANEQLGAVQYTCLQY